MVPGRKFSRVPMAPKREVTASRARFKCQCFKPCSPGPVSPPQFRSDPPSLAQGFRCALELPARYSPFRNVANIVDSERDERAVRGTYRYRTGGEDGHCDLPA